MLKVRVYRQKSARPEVPTRILRIDRGLQVRGVDLAERVRKAGITFNQRAVEIEGLQTV